MYIPAGIIGFISGVIASLIALIIISKIGGSK